MILTLTINPAIDRNFTADRLAFEDRGYILASSESAGGRGINASRLIHTFGGQTFAIATAGGKLGGKFEALLRNESFPVEVIPIANDMRSNLTISDRHGLSVKLNELGPEIDEAELKLVGQSVKAHLDGASWLMLCGSIPPSVDIHFYCKLIELAREHGVKSLLDTDGDALLHGLEARPSVVTPNQQEAERLLNRALITRPHFLEAAERLHEMGSEAVVLSLGARGAVVKFDGGLFEVIPPRIDAVCPIGSGDALSAAFTWAAEQGKDLVDATRWGVAAGTASAKLPGLRTADLEQTRDVYKHVEVRHVG